MPTISTNPMNNYVIQSIAPISTSSPNLDAITIIGTVNGASVQITVPIASVSSFSTVTAFQEFIAPLMLAAAPSAPPVLLPILSTAIGSFSL